MKKRPKAIVKKIPFDPGAWELWFGKWVLTAGTDRERLEALARSFNPLTDEGTLVP